MKKINLTVLYLCAVTMTACGGGSSGSASVPTPVPAPTSNPENTTTLLSNGATANYNTISQTVAVNQPINSTIMIQSPESQNSTIYTVTYSVANELNSAITKVAKIAQTGSAPIVTTTPTPCVITGNGSCEVTISADNSTNGSFEITGNIYTNTGVNQALQTLLVTASSNPTPTSTPTTSPTPTPTPDPTLQNYINLLHYTAPEEQKALTGDNLDQTQMTMKITNNLEIKNITVNYYLDPACTSIDSGYTMDGSSILNAGNYTTTSDSNLFLCSNYTSSLGNGCVYSYSNTHSLRYIIITNNDTIIRSSCMTNPKWFGERIGYYNAMKNWSRNCVNNFNCGYSQAYTFNVN